MCQTLGDRDTQACKSQPCGAGAHFNPAVTLAIVLSGRNKVCNGQEPLSATGLLRKSPRRQRATPTEM
eukprot:5782-Amphidinium_carterae.2